MPQDRLLYLVTSNDVNFAIIETKRDLTEEDVNKIMREESRIPKEQEYPYYHIHTVFNDVRPDTVPVIKA